MNDVTAIIGLDRDIAETIRARVRSLDNRVLIYDTIPDGYSESGLLFLRHPTVVDRWVIPSCVIYYSYFDNAIGLRKTLAFSKTPTWPPVDKTIIHDDKDLSLIHWGYHNKSNRGYVPKGVNVESFNSLKRVGKQGDNHCGDGKFLIRPTDLPFTPKENTLIEPFIEGESYRVLVLGDRIWVIHYQSRDWRKNVDSTQTVIDAQYWDRVICKAVAKYTSDAKRLGLPVVGFDFIHTGDEGIAIELNCYPGIPESFKGLFIKEACDFVERSLREKNEE